MKTTDFLVECNNPKALDTTLNQMGAALIEDEGSYFKKDGYYVMRVFGDPGFIKFAVTNQGYCKIVEELTELT